MSFEDNITFNDDITFDNDIVYKDFILPEWNSIQNLALNFSNELENNDIIGGFSSVELYPIEKTIDLYLVLKYMLTNKQYSFHKKEYERISKNYLIISTIINKFKSNHFEIREINKTLWFLLSQKYGHPKNQILGRLYSQSVSLMYLSRDVRYCLFNNEYFDIDIINSHPSILLHEALSDNLNVPELFELVNERENYFNKIRADYPNFKEINPKMLILACINQTKNDYKSKSLCRLTVELVQIRKNLYYKYYNTNSTNNVNAFKEAVDSRMNEDIRVREKKLNLLVYRNKLLQKIQSLFCFQKETEILLHFRAWLIDNIKIKHPNAELSTVPFFDGLYIKSTDKHILNEYILNELIFEYNKLNPIKFKLKNFEMTNKIFKNGIKEFNSIREKFHILNEKSFKEITDLMTELNILNPEKEIICLLKQYEKSIITLNPEDAQKIEDLFWEIRVRLISHLLSEEEKNQ